MKINTTIEITIRREDERRGDTETRKKMERRKEEDKWLEKIRQRNRRKQKVKEM